jgi:hypothetical protein
MSGQTGHPLTLTLPLPGARGAVYPSADGARSRPGTLTVASRSLSVGGLDC